MVKATLANTAWLAASAPAWMAFASALDDPARAQQSILRRYLQAGAESAFGREHGLANIRTYEQFASRVPIRSYDELRPWIERVRRGEQDVLTTRPIRRLVPTSGSTAARKLIPHTGESHRELQRAVGPWIFDLYHRSARLIAGTSYWSVTPQAGENSGEESSSVPIGYDSDSEYLGGWIGRLIDAALAVPERLKQIESIEVLRYVTLLLLLRHRELGLISVWHPSFLELLLGALPAEIHHLIRDISSGECACIGSIPTSLHQIVRSQANPRRSQEIERAGPGNFKALWPNLTVISCWADGHAASAASALSRAMPGVMIQPKGLLATEGVISIPFNGRFPLAIRSHFFEFIDPAGRSVLASDLKTGQTYDVVLSTAGGLWRYRLDDRVLVTGVLGRTPSIRFVGKTGLISDRMGEKLSEGFVASVLARFFATDGLQPTFSLLAPNHDRDGLRYTLYMTSPALAPMERKLDDLLCENPQYAYCRKLGQILAANIIRVSGDAHAAYFARLAQTGQRIGDIKPASLSRLDGWSEWFAKASGTLPPAQAPEMQMPPVEAEGMQIAGGGFEPPTSGL